MAPLIVEDAGSGTSGYHTFGAGAADVTTDAEGNAVGGIQLTIWDAEVGGTQITDLLDTDGVPLPGYITSSSDAADIGRLRFQAPSSYSVVYGDRGYGDRFVFTARESLTRLGTAIAKADQAAIDSAQAVNDSTTALTKATTAETRADEALTTADSAYEVATSATVRDLQAELPSPLYFAHRGSLMAPENTLEAFRLAVLERSAAVELDLRVTADDQLVVMHDTTVTRTVAFESGAVADYTASRFVNLPMDMTLRGPAYSADRRLYPPTLAEVLESFADRVYLSLECKTDRAAELLPAYLDKYLKLKTNVVCTGASIERMQPCIDAGYYVAVQDTATDPLVLAGAGVKQVNMPTGAVTAERVEALHAAGLRVQVYNVATQAMARRMLDLGVDALMTDDVPYVEGTRRRTTDPWASQSWYHGHISAGAANGGDADGTYQAPNWFGFDNEKGTDFVESGVLAGWASPVGGDPDADDYTIDFTFKIDANFSTASNVGIAISDTDEVGWPGGDASAHTFNGYVFIIRAVINQLQVRRYDNGVGTVLATVDGDNFTLGTPQQARLTITPTTVRLQNLTTPVDTGDVAATESKGGYIWLTAAGTDGFFSAMTITPSAN